MNLDDADHELLMPFVVVRSVGGPYDDDAYTAGWSMGSIDTKLSIARHLGTPPGGFVVRVDNLPQMELVAMKHGATVERVDDGTEPWSDEWAMVVVSWTTEETL